VAAIGTRISLETDQGTSYTRVVIGSVGTMTDQAPELSFGLGELDQVRRVIIQRPNGQTEIISASHINQKTAIN